MISSEIEEVLGLAHRVLVMRRGAITREFGADPPLDAVMEAAFGLGGSDRHDRCSRPGRRPGDPVPAGDRARGRPTGSPLPPRAQPRRIKAEHVRDYGIVVFAIALFIYFSRRVVRSSSPSSNLLNLVYPERDRRHRRVRGHAHDHRRQLRPLARGDLRARARCLARGPRSTGACGGRSPSRSAPARAWASSTGCW